MGQVLFFTGGRVNFWLSQVPFPRPEGGRVRVVGWLAPPGGGCDKGDPRADPASRPPRMTAPPIAPTTRPPTTKPMTATVSNPPEDIGVARYRFWLSPTFALIKDRTEKTTASSSRGRTLTASQNPESAGLDRLARMNEENKMTSTIATAAPRTYAHRFCRKVNAAATRKSATNRKRNKSRPPPAVIPPARTTGSARATSASALYVSAPAITQSENGVLRIRAHMLSVPAREIPSPKPAGISGTSRLRSPEAVPGQLAHTLATRQTVL